MLADALLANDTLVSLNLGYTHADDLDAWRLAGALQQGTVLTSLTLFENNITSEGVSPHPLAPQDPPTHGSKTSQQALFALFAVCVE